MASLREIIEANKAKLAAEKQAAPPVQQAPEPNAHPPQPNGKADDPTSPPMVTKVVQPVVKLSPLQARLAAQKEAKAKSAEISAKVDRPAPIVSTAQPGAAAAPTLPSGPITKTQVVATPPTAAGAGLTQVSLEQIQGNIKYLAENIEQRDLVGQVVRTIFMQLKQNPQFSTLISDNEFDVITRGFMSAYHAAARKRVEGKEKKSVKAEIKAKVGASVDVMFDELDKFFK